MFVKNTDPEVGKQNDLESRKMGKILIVDDSEVVRMQISRILSGAGYEVLAARDGPEGIKFAADHPDISIILSDYNMPDMSGLTMLEAIKKTSEHKNTFCGVLTTESSPSLKERGKAIGVSFWIVKPVEDKKLIKVTETIMARLEAS